jgi:hypothetical protein
MGNGEQMRNHKIFNWKTAGIVFTLYLTWQFFVLTDWEFLHPDAKTSELIQISENEFRNHLTALSATTLVPSFDYVNNKGTLDNHQKNLRELFIGFENDGGLTIRDIEFVFQYRTDELRYPSLTQRVVIEWLHPKYPATKVSVAHLVFTFHKVQDAWEVRSWQPKEEIVAAQPKSIFGEEKLWPKKHFMFIPCFSYPEFNIDC